MSAPTRELPRLLARYREDIAPALQGEFGYENVMQIPRLTKIVVNMGVGEATRDAKLMDGAVRDLTAISSTQRGAQQGGIVTQEAPIHVSNVMVIDSEDKPTRVGYRKDEEGRNIRVSRRTGKDL